MPKTPEQLARYAATQRERLHAIAIAEGRDPTLIGRPPKVTPEEKREKRRLKALRANAKRREKKIAAGWVPSKAGAKRRLTDEERQANRIETYKRFRANHLEERRVYEKEWMRRKTIQNAIAEGRYPGAKGYLARKSKEDVEAYLAAWRCDEGKFYKAVKAQNSRCKKLGVPGILKLQDVMTAFAEQGGCCAFCGAEFTEEKPEIDHWVPISKGGSNEGANIRLMHSECNKTKGSKTPEELAVRYAA
jgi:5-methylcytosine-specific restriction endonuclease McrA